MATGRWVVQHHRIPSVDVFSYTAQGQPWIYPVGAGLAFYAAYLLGGYALISWIGALAFVLTVGLLLRRGSAASAGIAILAVPLIAPRMTPRADIFTIVLFAALLSLLWENFQTGRARLWLLPLLMVAWVNLHPGFVAGLGLVVGYVCAELLETLIGDRRPAAVQRLRRAAGWLLGAGLATLVNPWGFGIYQALIRQERATGQQQTWITEWISVPFSWTAVGRALSPLHAEGTIYVLLAVAIVAAAIALPRVQLGAAMLLLVAMYPAIRYLRMGALFGCVVVVVGGWVLSRELARDWIRPAQARSVAAFAVVLCLALLTSVRCFDLATNHRYLRDGNLSTFGAGLGWWFPQGAAEFIEREKVPGEVFNTYNEGGYFTWRLGPERQDYLDGRALPFGLPLVQRHDQLLQESPDSALWVQETSRYHINTILLPLGRYEVQKVRLKDFCYSKAWRPVYLDEISAVFVRRTPETEGLIRRFPVDCATAPLPVGPPTGSGANAFTAWTDAASVLAALGRDSEALTATGNALSAFPGSAFLHWMRARLLFVTGQGDPEQEYLTAIAIQPSEAAWTSLAELYQKRNQIPEATEALQHAVDVSLKPHLALIKLGYFYLGQRHPYQALEAFDKASWRTPWGFHPLDDPGFAFALAQGRSGAWEALDDLKKATSYQEEAARFAPDAPAPWRRLAELYERSGRVGDSNRAKDHAAKLEAGGIR